jgi:hypothetical protein
MFTGHVMVLKMTGEVKPFSEGYEITVHSLMVVAL